MAVPRRVRLPGATELFRPTTQPEKPQGAVPAESGRIRHDQKITVYLSNDELLALETARLRLRAEFGVTADRGRLVRRAIALALAGLESDGEASELVQRLRQ